jgi:ribulose-phosphate 3-epimerase
MSFQADFLDEVKKNGWKAGLALDIFTPLDAIDDDVWSKLDSLLLMGVEAGRQSQEMHPHLLEKVAELAEREELRCQVIVDGGVKLANINDLIKAGVKEFTVGSEIWTSSDPAATIQEFLAKD